MPRINQSLCLGCYLRDGISLEQLVKFAADTGFAAVEFWGREGVECQKVYDLAKQAGIRIASMSAHGTLTEGMNDRANHSRIIDEIHESIDLAVKWEIPGLQRVGDVEDFRIFFVNRDGKVFVPDVIGHLFRNPFDIFDKILG